jgi:SAM-dependent methyltransferase
VTALRARLYEWELAEVFGRTDQDLDWWLQVTAGRSPVLELGCGTGRLTVPLAAAGVQVVGVDIDPEMLGALAERSRRTEAGPGAPFPWPFAIAGDMRSFALHCRFGAVIIPYNSIQLLSGDGEAERCLRGAAGHLRAGGVVALEVTDFQTGAGSASVGPEVVHVAPFGDGTATLWGGLEHDLAGRRSRYHRRIELSPGGAVLEETITLRCFDRSELTSALAGAGLTPRSWWSSGGAGATVRVVAGRDAAS